MYRIYIIKHISLIDLRLRHQCHRRNGIKSKITLEVITK